MATIVTRDTGATAVNRPLTNTELDNNFINLNNDLATRLTQNQQISITGDITGTGTTSITGTLATVNSNIGSFGSATAIPVITVNAKGLITAVSITSVSIPSGSLNFTGDITGSGTTGSTTTLTLANSGVTAGTYTSANITVDAKGRITSASSGSGGGSSGGGASTWSELLGKPTFATVAFTGSYNDLLDLPIFTSSGISLQNIEGGSASTYYDLAGLYIDGGAATSVYTEYDLLLDGGGAL
jgi:hypothetical protein